MSINNIVVSVTGGEQSIITTKYAIYLAKLLNAKLTAVYVVDKKSLHDLLKSRIFVEIEALEFERELEQQGKHFLERAKKLADTKQIQYEGLLLEGVIHEQVVSKTKALNADLLVMGELKEIISIKETYFDEGERIFREAPCPVVVVKNAQKVEALYKEV